MGITCKNRIGEKDIVILDLRDYNEKGTLKMWQCRYLTLI